ncbi:S-adenosyl-L-methionine-dependent methyltransferase family protein [Synechococcus sp. BIOS-E4-1]|uniref:tRNA (5-methylaminomethyl-2-thiouridine)(34)-methyltransferase MnmD n=1 Tax=Synechococcus sp. BIOS-E4-1 TaxID=1400864 RepID=UPI001648BACD|nr:MnmC family methyltransferase [Synechococcus sp. BIOS-E4-1]QNI54311.1 S-adenosyl-L-methionine-dependent methyltransferase family protein [Synechococcus sp. BIOS-E4-1]
MNLNHPLGQLRALETADGSLSLHSDHFDEAFHSSAGALEEAEAKFVRPAELGRFSQASELKLLDVCFGLGYNSAAVMRSLPQTSAPRLQWWGLELDQRPLEWALNHPPFCDLWPGAVLQRLAGLQQSGRWHDCGGQGTMLWGDARQNLKALPSNSQLDLILLDAFSPGCCPQLWSEEFLGALASRLAPGGRLLTYCRAAAVRSSLRRAGLTLRSLLTTGGQRREWSSGTLAVKPVITTPFAAEGPGWTSLSAMEEEHLNTRASVPYRDPKGIDEARIIQQRREREQQSCDLESTSSWQRRWLIDQSPRHGSDITWA